MSASIWWVSDLHLTPDNPRRTQAFLTFLQHRLKDCSALYLLGDLFDYWIGDDYHLVTYPDLIHQLRKFSFAGIPVYWMAGNRDFLLGAEFTTATQSLPIEEPYLLTLPNQQQALLLHGDILCTDDLAYQQLRLQLRDTKWQHNFLARSIKERLHIAQQLRQASQYANQNKTSQIMDVNQQAVDDLMDKYQVDLLIHGHTHRPAHHQWLYKGIHRQRIVLGDWDQLGWGLQMLNQSLHLIHWPLTART